MNPSKFTRVARAVGTVFVIAFFFVSCQRAVAQSATDYPLGPIGGSFRVTDGSNLLRVTAVTAGAPGNTAGLQVGDYIYGAFGQSFSPTGNYHFGACQELGFAVDRAEAGDGVLPLLVLRGGTGGIAMNVALPAAGAFGVAYPRNSAKYDGVYETAVASLHTAAMNGNGNLGYPTGWTGLALLGHPNWNDTTGARPYRLSINKIRDFVVGQINAWPYAPVEGKLLDGTSNPNSNGGASNWELGQKVMFLAEYYAKTADAAVAASLQRGAEMCGNAVQWWKQPAESSSGFSPEYDRVAGMSSHAGVSGDYMHHGWSCGINITGCYSFNGMAFARRAGMNMEARPRDGHYFGFNLNQGDPIPASIANALPASINLPQYGADSVRGATITDPFWYDPSVNQKFLMQLNFMARRSASYAGGSDDGMVGYAPEAITPHDAGGRTPGTLLGMAMYQQDVGGLDAADLDRMERLKGYIVRNYMRHQEAHAYCVGAQAYQALCMPYLSDRQQRFVMDNWRFFFALSRTDTNGFRYFPSRSIADNYLNTTHCAAINIALPHAIANGHLELVPAYNTNRSLANFKSPVLKWPSIAARTTKVTTATQDFVVDVCDGDGNVLTPASYTATWSHVSGPATATFSPNNTANTTVTFPSVSTTPYRIRLTVVRAGVPDLVEDIDVTRANATTPVTNAIVTHPTPQSTAPGGSASFTVGVTGSGPFLYQWRLNGVAYWGTSTFSTLNLTNVGSGWIGSYDCVVSTPTGLLVSNSAPFTLSGVLTRVPGALKREVWNSLAGSVVANLTGITNYPLFPSVTGKVTSAEAPQTYGDNYGQKLSGWIKPPASGNYRFFIASDDASELWLSTNDNAANKVKIAEFTGATAYRSYSTGAQSVLVNLVAGQKYYIEIIHKEAGGGDHLNVAWQLPGGAVPANGAAPIEGAYLEYDDYLSTLAHHWKLDEESGTSCEDSVGTATATLNNAPTRVAGILGNALSFNTASQYAQATVNVSETAYTASLWFRGTQASGGLFRVTGNSIPLDRLIMLRYGQVRAFLGVAIDGEGLTSPGTYNDGEWHHVVHTFGGGVGGQKLYVDGVLVDSGSKSSSTVTAQTGIRLGFSDTNSGIPGFIGQIDDVRTFESALFPQEVAAIFNETLNAAPQVNPDTFVVAENAPVGTVVGNVIATDPNDGQTLTYSIDGGNFGDRFVIDPSTGALTVVVPPDFETSGTYTLTITATDNGTPVQSATATATINVTDLNEAPVFAGNPVIGQAGAPGTAYSGNLTAFDPDAGDSVTYTKDGGPSWLAVANDGTLSGTPAVGDAGINNFTVTATDNALLSATTTLRIEVVNVAVTPIWTNAGGGLWPDGGNWLANSIANGQAIVADFSTLNLGANATVSLNGARTIGGLKFGDTDASHSWTLNTGSAGPLTLDVASGSPKVTVNNQTATLSVALAGNDGLIKDGAGTLLLSGANIYTGATTLSAGTLALITNNLNTTSAYTINDANTAASNTTLQIFGGFINNRNGLSNIGLRDFSPITVTGNGSGTSTLDFNCTTGNWLNGTIAINKAVVLKSSGAGIRAGFVTISGNGAGAGNDSVIYDATGNTSGGYNWNTFENTGTYAPQPNTYLGNVRFTGGATTLQNKTYSNAAYANLMIPDTASVTVDAGSTVNFAWGSESFDALNGGGTISSSTFTLTIGVSNGSGAYSGGINSSLSLVKTGTGTQALGGGNTYTGTTSVNGGKLLINGSLANSATTVAAAGTLGGTGTIAGAVTNNGTLAPGNNTVGNLTVNNTLTLAGGSHIEWDITDWTGTAGSGCDKLTANSLNLTATAGSPVTIHLNEVNLANFANESRTFTLVHANSAITGFDPAKFVIDDGDLATPQGTWSIQISGNDIMLAYTASNPDSNANGILDDWEAAQFHSTNAGANRPGDDADGDGLTNLMEFALDTDPLVHNAGPVVNHETISGRNYLRITVDKNPQATNLIYTVETCSELNDWSTVNAVIEPSPQDQPNQLIVRDSVPMSSAQRRFIRLKVRTNP